MNLKSSLNDVGIVDAVIAAVAHTEFKNLDMSELKKHTRGNTPFLDIKAAFDKSIVESAGFSVWRL